MSTMGAIYCNRENVNHGDEGQIMSLRTLQDNKSNILGNQKHLVKQKRIINTSNQNKNNNSINCQNNNVAIAPLYERSRLKKQVKNGQPPPVAVARRNARERNRVKQVNNGFATLRQHIPSQIAAGYGDRGKKLSKVETLRMAVEYIRRLQKLLAEADGTEYESNTNTRHNVSPKSMMSSGSLGCSRKFDEHYHSNDEDDAKDSNDHKDVEIKRPNLVIRLSSISRYTQVLHTISKLSPNSGHNSTLLKDYFDRSGGNEENLKPKTRQRMNVDLIISRLSPTSSSSSSENKYFTENNEENLEPRLLSPFSRDGDSKEGVTTYAASPEIFSGALYYKQEITETGEFMDVVTWWEQEQGKLVHQTQLQAQRLAHV